MRVLKVISCAILCALILLSSCFYVFAAEPESSKPKKYSEMSEEELLANGQVPINYLLKNIQKQLDKTIKDDKGKEIRVYNLSESVKQEDGTYEFESVPVGKFNLVSFLQDKKFLLDYRAYPDETSSQKYKPSKKDNSYIYSLYVFDVDPTISVTKEDNNSEKTDPSSIYEHFILCTKPNFTLNSKVFRTYQPNSTPGQYFTIEDRLLKGSVNGAFLSFSHTNSKNSGSGWVPNEEYSSFYMNFMPPGGEGMLEPYVVTDKDISSEKKYVDDPNRPDGNYKYAVYEYNNDKMISAQYFTEKPEVYKTDTGSSVQYEVLFNRYKAESGEVIDRLNWEFWMPESTTYFWLIEPNSFSEPSKKPATYHYTDDSPDHTSIKFSWEPFVGYDGEIYQDNAVLVDGNGFVANRPTGSYPYVIKRYVNSQLYETFYFQEKPNVTISDVVKNYDKKLITAKISVTSFRTMMGQPSGALWYSKKQDVFYVPKNPATSDLLKETYDVNMQYSAGGSKKGNYLTFNWDAGAASDELNKFNPFYDGNGDNLDPFFDPTNDNITDDEGNLVGQGDGSKPNKNNGSGFDFGDDFEFNADSLWRYANEFLNFCKNTFAVLPSFIWQIVATGFVIVVILRILGR